MFISIRGLRGSPATFLSLWGLLIGICAGSTIAIAPALAQLAVLESPEDGPVSGIGMVRGWAFASEPGESFGAVELFIDGQNLGQVPCCSERADVQAAFPQYPAQNTLNSGWGLAFNWGILSAGSHTLQFFRRGRIGGLSLIDTRTVTVVKPGDFEYIDRFDLSQAIASIQDNELTVNGIIVRDQASQQQKQINTRFRWFENLQAFGLVEAETVAQVSSLPSLFSSLLASLSALFSGGVTTVANAQVGAPFPFPQTSFEEPAPGQQVSGIGAVRGWAFYPQGNTPLEKVWLSIDDQPAGTLPCCSDRADVAAAFPESPNALHSGWGGVFNYGRLSSGPHTITVEPVQLGGYDLSFSNSVWVVRPGDFEFLDQFDLSNATAQVITVNPWGLADSKEIHLEGVRIRDKASQQEKVITANLRWFVSSQTLGLVR